jgi:hypothetical protein
MRFLTRLLKTPEEDENEDQDEFDAEESGLLMIPSLSADREGTAPAATPNADAPQAEVPAAEGELADPPSEGEASPAQDQAGEPVADGGETPDTTEESSPLQSEGAETAPEEGETEEASPDDPMSMFRGSAKRTHMAPVLKDNLEDIPAVELLAVARSIRNSLLGKQAVSGAGQGNEKAA